jgi:hypothetical protein
MRQCFKDLDDESKKCIEEGIKIIKVLKGRYKKDAVN